MTGSSFRWVAMVLTTMASVRVSEIAALLLLAYLLRTCFAAILNASIRAKYR